MMIRRSFLKLLGISAFLKTTAAQNIIHNPCTKKRPKLIHISTRPDRLDRNPELIYAQYWAERNERKPWLNGGFTILEWILNHPDQQIPGPVSQRDATVAASVIQWLGTHCGMAFISTCEREIKKQGTYSVEF